jgi:VanZ family protein
LTSETERKLRAWVLVGAYVLLVFGVSSIPGTARFGLKFIWSDKAAHLCEYAGLGLFLTAAYRASLSPRRRRLLTLLTIATAAAIGAVDETYQMFLVPGRAGELLDWVADVAGATIGHTVAGIFLGKRSRTNRRVRRRSRST